MQNSSDTGAPASRRHERSNDCDQVAGQRPALPLPTPHVLVHIVTYGHAQTIEAALTALDTSQQIALTTVITDNNSGDDSWERIQSFCARPRTHTFRARQLSHNIGFCGGQNSIIAEFLSNTAFSHLCIFNPDVAVTPACLFELTQAQAPMATPKLLRGDFMLKPVEPRRLDGTGMILTNSLRHFDRGSQELDQGQYNQPGWVFGGTGACLLLSRDAVVELLIPRIAEDAAISLIHPEIWKAEPARLQLFDEGFFAYREDAELGWRAQRRGVRCRYVPQAIAIHKRSVLPDEREHVSPFINRLGVRNRFLLQALHFSHRYHAALATGFLLRNLLVLGAILIKERSSLKAITELWILRRRTARLRAYHTAVSTVSDSDVARWMQQTQE